MEISAELEMLGKIVIAAVLGGLVGLEREFAERPAGLRTPMLVGAKATLFIVLADIMLSTFACCSRLSSSLGSYNSASPWTIMTGTRRFSIH